MPPLDLRTGPVARARSGRRRPRTQRPAFVGAHGVAVKPSRPAPKPRPAPRTQRPVFVGAHGAAVKPSRPAPRPYRPTPKQVQAAHAIKRAQGREQERIAKRQPTPRVAKQFARNLDLTRKLVVARANERAISAAAKEPAERERKNQALATVVAPGTVRITGDYIKNVPKDVGELAITTPTSIAKLGIEESKSVVESVKKGSPTPFLKQQERVGKGIVKAYTDVAKDPGKALTEHPVSTMLMFNPLSLEAGAGRLARAAGRQSLKRSAATLPGTTLKQARTGSRGIVRRAVETQRDKRPGAARIKDRELERRTDEFHDWGQLHKQAAVERKAAEVNEQLKKTPKKLRKPARDIQTRPVLRTVRQIRRNLRLRDLGRGGMDASGRLHAFDSRTGKRAGKLTGKPNSIHKERYRPEGGEGHGTRYTYFNEEGEAVGVASVDSGGSRNVFVDPDYRRQGIARKLYSEAEKDGYNVTSAKGNLQTELGDALVRGMRKPSREGTLSKPERQAIVEDALSGARGGAHQHVDREFAHEFGSHWHVNEHGKVNRPAATSQRGGVIHASRADADKVAAELGKAKGVNWEPKVIELEGKTPGETSGFAVVPKVAADRFRHHKRVGKSPATGAVVMRVGSRQFRKTVLPLSTKWLAGQGTEGALRAAAMGAGPFSLVRYKRALRELERTDPDAARTLRRRVSEGGQFGITGPAAEFAGKGRTLGEEFADTGLARPAAAVSKAAALPIVRLAPKGYNKLTGFVFHTVNGRIEQLAKETMAGKALKQGPLMERSILDLTGKATREAAQGLTNTSSQIQLARAVERAYGKYSRMGPHARETILHTTPFIPWFGNMVNFLGRVMPVDHPVKTSLAASLVQADEEWRKKNRLSYRGKDRVPDWLMGAYPAGKNKFVPVGRFGPFLGGEPVSDIASQVLPQFSGPFLNLVAGVDWKGQPIRGGQGKRLTAGAVSASEALIPFAGAANRVTGLGNRYIYGKDKPSVVQGKKIPAAVLDLFNPVRATALAADKKKKRGGSSARKNRPLGGSLGSGGGGGVNRPLGGSL